MHLIKYVIPISRLAAFLSTIVDLSSACGVCFLKTKRAEATSVTARLERCGLVFVFWHQMTCNVMFT